MLPTDVVKITNWAGADTPVMARVLNTAGAVINQAAVSSIACKVCDQQQANAVVATPSFTVAGTIYNTLQLGNGWTQDGQGWNFLAVVPGTATPGNSVYRAQWTLTMASGGPLYVVAVINTQAIL